MKDKKKYIIIGVIALIAVIMLVSVIILNNKRKEDITSRYEEYSAETAYTNESPEVTQDINDESVIVREPDTTEISTVTETEVGTVDETQSSNLEHSELYNAVENVGDTMSDSLRAMYDTDNIGSYVKTLSDDELYNAAVEIEAFYLDEVKLNKAEGVHTSYWDRTQIVRSYIYTERCLRSTEGKQLPESTDSEFDIRYREYADDNYPSEQLITSIGDVEDPALIKEINKLYVENGKQPFYEFEYDYDEETGIYGCCIAFNDTSYYALESDGTKAYSIYSDYPWDFEEDVNYYHYPENELVEP